MIGTFDTVPGLIIAAPASGCGKTTVSLALMRALSRRGTWVAPAKVGPDYIDPGFHTAACGRVSVNLDPWAMQAATRRDVLDGLSRDADLILIEGVMGLFDGAADGRGATADLAAETGIPVVLVVDAKGQGASAAATVRGFASHRRDIEIAGVLFNRVGGPRHADILDRAMADSGLDVPVLGHLGRHDSLTLDSRHLGLIQARERADLPTFLDRAADWIEAGCDLSALQACARPPRMQASADAPVRLKPPGSRIAIARDVAFDFAYPHLLDGWRATGAEIVPFSPLADAAPDTDADAVYLPGGYPELHAGRLAGNHGFLDGLKARAASGALIFGECGGYMVLGRGLTDADGHRHAMAGLLGVETRFDRRRLHLGYRRLKAADTAPWIGGRSLMGHEFHYAAVDAEEGDPLFEARNALGETLPAMGLRAGRILGSFAHLIDVQGAVRTQTQGGGDDLLGQVGLGGALTAAEQAVDGLLSDAASFLGGKKQ